MELAARYIELLKNSVSGLLYVCTPEALVGRDVMPGAHTSIGGARLDNIQQCVQSVIREDIPGDLMEAGVWRGGACIFMRGLLEACGDTERVVFAADSFEGLPAPTYPQDSGLDLHTRPELSVSLAEVAYNFARYDLLDARTHFIQGWFAETLPGPVERLAVLRLDADMYGSTMQALTALYPKVSTGGFVIVDDYNDIPACKAAVGDYRAEHGINDEIVEVDWTCVYWRKSA